MARAAGTSDTFGVVSGPRSNCSLCARGLLIHDALLTHCMAPSFGGNSRFGGAAGGRSSVFGLASGSRSSRFSCVGALVVPKAHVADHGGLCGSPRVALPGKG